MRTNLAVFTLKDEAEKLVSQYNEEARGKGHLSNEQKRGGRGGFRGGFRGGGGQNDRSNSRNQNSAAPQFNRLVYRLVSRSILARQLLSLFNILVKRTLMEISRSMLNFQAMLGLGLLQCECVILLNQINSFIHTQV